MRRKTLTKRRWELIPLAVALTLTLAVVAVPASAKGPVFVPYTGCAAATEDGIGTDGLRAPCQSGEAVTGRQGSDRADADIFAGTVAVVVLVIAGGMLVVTASAGRPRGRPAGLRSTET
jgi:hypothetical protein